MVGSWYRFSVSETLLKKPAYDRSCRPKANSNTMHPVLQCVNFGNAQGMKAIKSNTRPLVGTRFKA